MFQPFPYRLRFYDDKNKRAHFFPLHATFTIFVICKHAM